MSTTPLPAVLPGPGSTDYARYMRTDILLSLQRGTCERAHPDELLFQVVHQSAELWFKLIHNELGRALDDLAADQPSAAELLVQRAVRSLRLVTEQLHILRHLHPLQFAAFRAELGNGSGFESPGWKRLREATTELDIAFSRRLSSLGLTPVDLYRGQPSDPLYRLAEALVSLDEQIALWRTEHYTVATRIIGQGVLGTRNTPVDSLTRLITHRRFPTLWEARTDVTESSPRGRQSRQAQR
ncbi:tryptophan 2,3-dioxygenase family protein [Micromonospora endolithica]|uniref:Tryptophan 2,3-dioxygenase n=1 Tax=Micromonospora endolithica TaxID=230091 RepID=A0A3A9ZS41_9ACTN|nr:tryptophan 2,3-dioxygenase family protein [Micromonospora endolithica]RKN50416.1 tryptophan 2,3-dioxygenase [Micromonospora endolithica]TWJ20899.1 tryptophan 2,3-dioxygenase [Micromonospora endolithica]